jgi:hypothetical protein
MPARVSCMLHSVQVTDSESEAIYVPSRCRPPRAVQAVGGAAKRREGASRFLRSIIGAATTQNRHFVSRLKLSGFYGLDFILESGTGVPYLIEMNPRCTQLGHIELAGEGCLAAALSAVLRGEPRPKVQNPIRGNTIALFPQALSAGEACRPYIDASHHDVPYEEPQLMRELMLNPWPQRRWAARLYHAFRPLTRASPIIFEDLDTETDPVAIAR